MNHLAPVRNITVLAVALLAIAACSGSAGGSVATSARPEATARPDPTAPPSAVPGPAGSAGASTPAMQLTQAWAVGALVDAASGEQFRIADHAGKVILVETMAIWCSNCLTQQRDVEAALERLPGDRVVYIVLDVDPNEDVASLAAYRAKHDFGGRYAVAGKDVARALAAEFGDQFLNPPSTPMLVVGTNGTVTRTNFGHKSAEEIVALLKANGA